MMKLTQVLRDRLQHRGSARLAAIVGPVGNDDFQWRPCPETLRWSTPASTLEQRALMVRSRCSMGRATVGEPKQAKSKVNQEGPHEVPSSARPGRNPSA